MTSQRIRELVDSLPARCPEREEPPAACSPLCGDEIGRTVFALTAPDFGAHYVDFLLKARLPLPNHVHDRSIWMAYTHLSGRQRNEHYERVLELRSDGNEFKRHVLEAYLLCEDLAVEQIAQRVKAPVQTIEVYSDLFFNLRDRADDPLYVASVVYPNTKLADLCGEFDVNDVCQHLLKVAYEWGSEFVDAAAGITARPLSVARAQACLQEIKNRLLQEGLLLATLGAFHSENTPPTWRAVLGLALSPRVGTQTVADQEVARQAPIKAAGSVREALQKLQASIPIPRPKPVEEFVQDAPQPAAQLAAAA